MKTKVILSQQMASAIIASLHLCVASQMAMTSVQLTILPR